MSSTTQNALTQNELSEARGWLSDCEFVETEMMGAEDRADFYAEMSDAEITRGVERHYDGGLHAFILATGMRKVVTQAEWDAKHADYKLSAAQSISGMPMMMGLDERGTYLAPVVIVAG